MANEAPSHASRRRTSTRGEFWKEHTLADYRPKARVFPGGDQFVIKDLTDEESEAFWAAIEGRD